MNKDIKKRSWKSTVIYIIAYIAIRALIDYVAYKVKEKRIATERANYVDGMKDQIHQQQEVKAKNEEEYDY